MRWRRLSVLSLKLINPWGGGEVIFECVGGAGWGGGEIILQAGFQSGIIEYIKPPRLIVLSVKKISGVVFFYPLYKL